MADTQRPSNVFQRECDIEDERDFDASEWETTLGPVGTPNFEELAKMRNKIYENLSNMEFKTKFIRVWDERIREYRRK